MKGHIEIFDYFITDLQCDVNTPVDDGLLPIHIAIKNGHLTFVQYLLQQPNCDIMGYSKGANESSLHSAVDYGDLELVKCLTSHKEVDPFSRDLLNGNMALHLAATTDDKHEIVEFFVSTYGPELLKIRNNYGQIPIAVAFQPKSVANLQYMARNVPETDNFRPYLDTSYGNLWDQLELSPNEVLALLSSCN